jgi:hypothetical protein
MRLPQSPNAPTKESVSIVAVSDRRAVLQSEWYLDADYGERVREIRGDLIKNAEPLTTAIGRRDICWETRERHPNITIRTHLR